MLTVMMACLSFANVDGFDEERRIGCLKVKEEGIWFQKIQWPEEMDVIIGPEGWRPETIS